MATIFLLGPSEWDPARGGSGAKTPMQGRRELATAFWSHGHHVLIMEDEKDLTALARLGITPVPWTTDAELRERAALLAMEVA